MFNYSFLLETHVHVKILIISVYKSPEYETLGFDLIKNKLLEMGYPEPIGEFEYDPTFPIRFVKKVLTQRKRETCDR